MNPQGTPSSIPGTPGSNGYRSATLASDQDQAQGTPQADASPTPSPSPSPSQNNPTPYQSQNPTPMQSQNPTPAPTPDRRRTYISQSQGNTPIIRGDISRGIHRIVNHTSMPGPGPGPYTTSSSSSSSSSSSA